MTALIAANLPATASLAWVIQTMPSALPALTAGSSAGLIMNVDILMGRMAWSVQKFLSKLTHLKHYKEAGE